MFDGLLIFYQRGFIGATLLLYFFVNLKGLLVNKPRGHKQGGWGYPKRPRHGNMGGWGSGFGPNLSTWFIYSPLGGGNDF